MSLAQELQYNKVIFETDNTSIAEYLWFGDASGFITNATWSRYCIDGLSRHPDWQVNLIRREANEAADYAAKTAKETGISWTTLDACPM